MFEEGRSCLFREAVVLVFSKFSECFVSGLFVAPSIFGIVVIACVM